MTLPGVAETVQRHLPVRRLQEDACERVSVAVPVQLQASAACTTALDAAGQRHMMLPVVQ